MDRGMTCEHLNRLSDVLEKDLWQSKENLTCFDCGTTGPNLWICLQPECRHVGCSEVKNDHSTIHHQKYPLHCVHMNVTTERIWCYLCEKEVHIRAAVAHAKVSPDSTSIEEMSVNTRLGSVGINVNDDEQDLSDMNCDDERPRGLVGLLNMGNTCYMNAALQALSNTQPLTSYFLECAGAVAVLAADKKPDLSRAYQKLMKDMWSRRSRGYVVPNGILYGIRNVHPMFRGYQQHDTQEFLRCLMDQLHEELKEPVLDSASEDKLASESEGEHQESRTLHVRRRAVSSGASDAPLFARMRRRSPAPSYTEPKHDGYLRIESTSEGSRHRRSASFGGTHHFTYNVLTQQINGPSKESPQRDVGSESELSCSSEAEERYETCSSGASDTDLHAHNKLSAGGGGGDGGRGGGRGQRYRSIVSDVFDGKLLSSVQCLICNRVSTRVETFQDLSLPIPSREHVTVLRCQQPELTHVQDSWIWWFLSWLRSWFYGPVVSLQDCLAAFFSADELKGDNMYSCSRCNKLRNGIKMSGVVRLPEVLCIHLKRFRHDLMSSAKVAARVSFPIDDLNMAPYTHKECTSKISRYSLCAVICHMGTAGGGHYTCIARPNSNSNSNAEDGWYSYDDATIAPVPVHHLATCEAYVLFYRKVNSHMATLRQKAAEILESASADNSENKFYISKQWINKFNTWAEPGPIDNSDFVCVHGGVRRERVEHLQALVMRVPQLLWEFLYNEFGGGPAVSQAHECGVCWRAARRLRARRDTERTAFAHLHESFQEQEQPHAIYAISMQWFRQWQAFIRNQARHPPPPLDNTDIVIKQDIEGMTKYSLKPGSDHAQLSEELWRFFIDIYGGGPEVKLKSPTPAPVRTPAVTQESQKPSRKYSESDREEYCSKSTSEMNIRDSIHTELQKNQSLQNISRRNRIRSDSDEEVSYRHAFIYKNHEPNGNYESDTDLPKYNTIRMENGVDSSDHDANDNTICTDSELPNVENISLKNKARRSGKVKKTKRRAVK